MECLCIFSFKKHASVDRIFTLMLVYRKQCMQMQEIFQMLQYLEAIYSIDTVVGDFNYDLLKRSDYKFLDIFIHHVEIVNIPTYISGFLINHVYIMKNLLE